MKKIFLILIGLILLTIAEVAYASYVRFSIGSSSGNSRETTSYEYFTTGSGSVSYYQGPVYPPYYYDRWSNGLWVAAANGDVPYHAFVHHYVNGRPIYLCRTLFNNRLLEGFLVPYEGCYIQPYNQQVRVNVYDVLLR